MKFKNLFFSMLASAAIVSCNNDVIGGGTGGGSEDDGYGGGESTTATFQLNFAKPGTYAGSEDAIGAGRESEIKDAALFIYKLDGTPEAMAYLISADFNASGNEKRITVKCKSGAKLIYLATNIGGDKLIKHELADVSKSNSTLADAYLGKDWNSTGNYGPKFSVEYNDGPNGTGGTPHKPLNSPIWSGSAGIEIGNTIPTSNKGADTLIRALTGFGDPTAGILEGDGDNNPDVFYLMSNWGDASTQPDDAGTAPTTTPPTPITATTYKSTCKFTLEPGIAADTSRNIVDYTPSDVNANKKNLLKINIQRAVAKVSLDAIGSGVYGSAGEGSSAGKFTPKSKWALGNINTSEYPFQMWDGSVVKSTRYDETEDILSSTTWGRKMDNSRFAGSSDKYKEQKLSASFVVDTIEQNSKNVAYGKSNYVLATENNNFRTYNHYSTFVVFAGTYVPDSYITGVAFSGDPSVDTSGSITYTQAGTDQADTLYYVSSLGTNGLFFKGMAALREYVFYKLGETDGPTSNPVSDTKTTTFIERLKDVTGNKQADLQAYWKGHCFYRVWIKDEGATSSANKVLVRRNHIYNVSITKIKSPGIGDPNDIIDPDPGTIEPLEEADTYVTAKVEIMNWHVINQGSETGLD
jgi:hypothetical protein